MSRLCILLCLIVTLSNCVKSSTTQTLSGTLLPLLNGFSSENTGPIPYTLPVSQNVPLINHYDNSIPLAAPSTGEWFKNHHTYFLEQTTLYMDWSDSSGNSYYIATTGDDHNNGAETSPFRTFTHAFRQLEPGDTLYVRAGTYDEQIIPTRSGESKSWLTIRAYPGEEHQAIIDGRWADCNDTNYVEFDDFHGLVDIQTLKYIRISGLKIKNSYWAGVGVYRGSDHIIIDNNIIENTRSSGIQFMFKGSDIVIAGNEVTHGVAGYSCGGDQEVITVSGITRFEVMNNEVHQGVGNTGTSPNGGEGIDIKDASSIGAVHHNYVHDLPTDVHIYIDAYSSLAHSINVYNNVIYGKLSDDSPGTGTGLAIGAEEGGTIYRVKVFNNIIAYTKDALIIADWGSRKGRKKDIEIFHNTIYGNRDTINNWGGGIRIDSRFYISDINVHHNIVSCNGRWQISSIQYPFSALTTGKNLLDGYNQNNEKDWLYEVKSSEDIESIMSFVDASHDNFTPAAGSDAIDGNPIPPAFDFFGRETRCGSSGELGAIESCP